MLYAVQYAEYCETVCRHASIADKEDKSSQSIYVYTRNVAFIRRVRLAHILCKSIKKGNDLVTFLVVDCVSSHVTTVSLLSPLPLAQ